MAADLALALAFWRSGDRFAALGAARRAAAATPDDARAHIVFAAIQRQVGYIDGAVLALERARALEPDNVEMLRMLADMYVRAGRFPEALRVAEAAFAADPSPASEIAFGNALLENDALAEADARFGRVLAGDARDVRAWIGRARTASARADWPAARAAYERALELAPGDPDVRCGLARLDLRFGRYAEGYAGYPAVMDSDAEGARYYYHREGIPRWDGAALAGRRLVISADQGLGDHIMMARFFDSLPAATPAVTVETPPPLVTLFARNFTHVHIARFTHWAPPATWDVHLPITQLPCLVGVRNPSEVTRNAYLRADPERVRAWQRRLADDPQLRNVGIVWHGNRKNPSERWRGAPLHHWEPLAHVAGVRFHSLQLGAGNEEIRAAPFPLATYAPFADMDDTAALMVALDAIISIDTATVHLAGALGRPAWLPNALVCDNRWGVDGVATPWYPSVRVIRQTVSGDWAPVFRTIAAELRAFTSR